MTVGVGESHEDVERGGRQREQALGIIASHGCRYI
jgi:hypothetical protein